MLAYTACTRLLVAVLLLVVHCVHSTAALSYSHNTDARNTPPPFNSVTTTTSITHIPSTPPSLISPATTTAPLSSLHASIHSVSGCLQSTITGTSGCNLTSVLTITGVNFVHLTALLIANTTYCNLSVGAPQLPTRIVTAVCPYYYPQHTGLDIRLVSDDNVSTAAMPSAVSFHGTAPYITSINSTCNVPPFNGCDPTRTNTITVYGRNFLSSPAPPVHLYVWLGTEYMPCRTLHITFNRFVCSLAAFIWLSGAPSPSTKFGVVAAVLDANWLREEVQSNFVQAVVSFNSPSPDTSSSSTGVPPTSPLPDIQRVSGCEDSFTATRNCPYPYTAPVSLRLIGNRFINFIGSLSVWIHNQPCPIIEPVNRQYVECSWDTNAIDWTEVGSTQLTVSLSTSAGWVNVSDAVSLNTVFANPSIESVSGCTMSKYEPPKTTGCDRSRTLTIYGDAFARYLPPTLTIAYSTTVDCIYPLANPLTIECPLHTAVLNGIVRNMYVPVQLRLGDRISEAVPYVSFAPDYVPSVPSSSSTGPGGGGDGSAPSADELVGMKLALLSLMIVSLIVMVVALAVWVTGWWLAHRRSYVSQHGQAAVDARQVLLQ